MLGIWYLLTQAAAVNTLVTTCALSMSVGPIDTMSPPEAGFSTGTIPPLGTRHIGVLRSGYPYSG